MTNKKVLFVGSFKSSAKDGSVGGQMFACNTLIKSTLSDSIDWTLLDSTASSNLKNSVFERVKKAVLRVSKFIKYLVTNKYDHVLIFSGDGWSFWEKGLMAIIAKKTSKAKVIIAPRSGFIINDINKKGLLSKFIIKVFKQVDIVICQSKVWKNLFSSLDVNLDDSKFVIIENIVHLENYDDIKGAQKDNNQKVSILFMAWVTRDKGIFELIEAVKILKGKKLNFELSIAGKGEAFEEIGSEIKKEDLDSYCKLKGWVLGEEKKKLFLKSDIFVLPTYFEGYPNSLIEAMATGIACISTKVGSIPDIIKHRKTGLLIEKKNINQLADNLEILITDSELRRNLALNAKEQVNRNNSVDVGIRKFKTLFGI